MNIQNKLKDIKNKLLLYLILDSTTIGRYKLSIMLGTSRAKTRAMLRELTENKNAESQLGRAGTRLTRKGTSITKRLKEIVLLDSYSTIWSQKDFIPKPYNSVTIFLKVKNIETNGIYERDLLVREGGTGAITLVKNKSNQWVFPEDKKGTIQTIKILNKEIIKKYNMLIIGFGSEIGSLFAGVAAVAVYHLGSELEMILN